MEGQCYKCRWWGATESDREDCNFQEAICAIKTQKLAEKGIVGKIKTTRTGSCRDDFEPSGVREKRG